MGAILCYDIASEIYIREEFENRLEKKRGTHHQRNNMEIFAGWHIRLRDETYCEKLIKTLWGIKISGNEIDIFSPFRNDCRYYYISPWHRAHFLPSFFDLAISLLISSCFAENSFHWRNKSFSDDVATSMQNYYKSKHYEFTLRGNFSGETRVWQKNENGKRRKKNVKPFQRFLSALAASVLERGINLVLFFLFLRFLFLSSF